MIQLAVLLSCLHAGPLSQSAAPTSIEWLTDLDRATRIATESGRPLMIVFR